MLKGHTESLKLFVFGCSNSPRLDVLTLFTSHYLGVPYPLTNGGQQLRRASGRCPIHHPSVTYILELLQLVRSED